MEKVVYADSSFWVSLYITDANSARADRLSGRLDKILFNRFVEHELRNAIRLSVFRKQITAFQGARIVDQVEADKSLSLRKTHAVAWERVFDRADKLSNQFTPSTGQRGADILHVALALESGAEQFITFDQRQAGLVKGVGLKLVS